MRSESIDKLVKEAARIERIKPADMLTEVALQLAKMNIILEEIWRDMPGEDK